MRTDTPTPATSTPLFVATNATGTGLVDYSDRYIHDPHGLFAELRRQRPVHRVMLDGAAGVHLVLDHATVRQLAADRRLSNDPRHANPAACAAVWPCATADDRLTANMLCRDGDEHARLRHAVTGQFTPERITALRPRIQHLVDDLIAAFPRSGSVEFSDFAQHVPLTVIADLLGVPKTDQPAFAALSKVYVGMADDSARLGHAAATMRDQLVALLLPRRGSLNPDGLLAQLLAPGSPLKAGEVLPMAFLLLVAGYETTGHLITNTLLALLRHPDQLTQVRHDPNLIPQAIRETLRWDPPIKVSPVPRFSLTDIPVPGAGVIPGGGEPVILGYAAASRDPQRFTDPDVFDLHRRQNGQSLGFGHGPHYCVGNTLGATEAEIALRALIQRTDDITLALDPVDIGYRRSRFMRGVTSLPLHLQRSSR